VLHGASEMGITLHTEAFDQCDRGLDRFGETVFRVPADREYGRTLNFAHGFTLATLRGECTCRSAASG
jgi:hypothetical protein